METECPGPLYDTSTSADFATFNVAQYYNDEVYPNFGEGSYV